MTPSLAHVRIANTAIVCTGGGCPLRETCYKALSFAAPPLEGVQKIEMRGEDTYGRLRPGRCDAYQALPILPEDWVREIDRLEDYARADIDNGHPLVSVRPWFDALARIVSDPDAPSRAANRALGAMQALRYRMDRRNDWKK